MCVILSAAKDLKCFAEVRLLRYYTVLSVEIPRRLGMTENGCSNHHFAYKKTSRMQSTRDVQCVKKCGLYDRAYTFPRGEGGI